MNFWQKYENENEKNARYTHIRFLNICSRPAHYLIKNEWNYLLHEIESNPTE